LLNFENRGKHYVSEITTLETAERSAREGVDFIPDRLSANGAFRNKAQNGHILVGRTSPGAAITISRDVGSRLKEMLRRSGDLWHLQSNLQKEGGK